MVSFLPSVRQLHPLLGGPKTLLSLCPSAGCALTGCPCLVGVCSGLVDFLIFFGIFFNISLGFVGCALVTVCRLTLISKFASCFWYCSAIGNSGIGFGFVANYFALSILLIASALAIGPSLCIDLASCLLGFILLPSSSRCVTNLSGLFSTISAKFSSTSSTSKSS